MCSCVIYSVFLWFFFFFSSRRRHTRSYGDWSSDVCSSDLEAADRRWDPRGRGALREGGPEPVLRDARGGGAVPVAGVPAPEIGRASCRERGEISVGGGG